MGTHRYLSQDDVDRYLLRLNDEDRKAEPGKKASKSKKAQIRAALNWYLQKHLKLVVNCNELNMKSNV